MNRSDIEFSGGSRNLTHSVWEGRARDLMVDAGNLNSAGEPQEMELVRLLKVVWSHKFLVLAITAACAIFGLAIAEMQTPMFKSHATVELLGINQNFLNLREVDPHAASSGENGTDAYISTEIELLRSEALIRKVVEKLDMPHHAAGKAGAATAIKSALHLHKASSTAPSVNALVQRALSNLTVEQVKSSNLLEISYSDPDPKMAADFINTLIEEAVQTNVDDRWNLSARVGTLLNKQVQLL
ncbi:MAG TPA: Wzz/FepE/Etk N-terminal domain-containing protein, partial [Bryobacteraceae bacterium]